MNSEWMYTLMYALQVIATFFILQNILAIDNVGIDAICELCLHISVLNYQLGNIATLKTSETAKKELFSFINEHQRIME